jgi:phosphofructokinase-like protein
MKIGILTAGGDCPGLNAAIRGVAKTALLEQKMQVVGISSGFLGLIENDYFEIQEKHLSGILTLGGTILGTSREKPFRKSANYMMEIDKPEIIRKNYKKIGLDCLVCIGGNGTMKTAHRLSELGMHIIGLPKTIDNDVWGTEFTFGFDSAVTIATEAIDRLHSTANSHKRIMVIEVMGHHAGWIALYAGVAAGGDIILMPEIIHDDEVIANYLKQRARAKKEYSIVVVAEGIVNGSKHGAGTAVAKKISKMTGLETRETVLGYIQRGGTPSPMDRILATRYGAYATELISREKYGQMVAIQHGEITAVPLNMVSDRVRTVPVKHPLVLQARNMGTCFGDTLCSGMN